MPVKKTNKKKLKKSQKEKDKKKTKIKIKNNQGQSQSISINIDQSRKGRPRQQAQQKPQQPNYIMPPPVYPPQLQQQPQQQQQQQPQEQSKTNEHKNVIETFLKNNEAQQQALASLTSRVDDTYSQNSALHSKLLQLQNNNDNFQTAFRDFFIPGVQAKFNYYGNTIDNLMERMEQYQTYEPSNRVSSKVSIPELEEFNPSDDFQFEDGAGFSVYPALKFEDTPLYKTTPILSQTNTDYQTPTFTGVLDNKPQKTPKPVVEEKAPAKSTAKDESKVEVEDVEDDETNTEIIEIPGLKNYVTNWDYQNDNEVKTTMKDDKKHIICNICGKTYLANNAQNIIKHLDRIHSSLDTAVGTRELNKVHIKDRGIYETIPWQWIEPYKENIRKAFRKGGELAKAEN